MTYHICHGGREGVKQERCPDDITLFGTRKNKEPVSKKILWNIFNVLETPPLNIAGLAKDWQYFENCGIESHNWEWAISESFQTSVN